MVINLKNEIESYHYGIYHLLKMIFPFDEVVCNHENADLDISYQVHDSFVKITCGDKIHQEPIVRDDVLLTLKRAIYRVCNANLPFGILTGVRPSQTALKFSENVLDGLSSVYLVSPEKARVMEQCANQVIATGKTLSKKEISLYIHIPFCPTRCGYCSFTLEYLKPYSLLIDDYFIALLTEVRAVMETLSECCLTLNSVYIGGGTPTVLTEKQLEQLIGTVLSFQTPKEFSVEAGRADTITYEKLSVLSKMGVNRISINPQTLNQATLDRIGRRHSVEEFLKAYEMSRKFSFETVNTDLIAGLPGETFLDFKHSLDGILELSPEHITLHTLCKKRTSDLRMQSDLEQYREAEKMLQYSYDVLEPTYEPYYIYRQKNAVAGLENIGFMRNGKVCNYNIFMMEEISSVVAVGAGGTSKLTDFATKKPFSKLRTDKQPERYMRDLDEIIKEKQTFLREGIPLL
ncbi:MAG: coproporphyrinogen dehydrogenase HemZ [Ruminococcaceae bacterium]|nr:coproporphyrinogen dehydrogenase HemZ [Oscillospiraceae bacterium]